MATLWMARGRRRRVGAEGDGPRGVARWRLSRRMQRLEKCNQSSRLRGAKILAVCGHVAASLNHLPDQLVGRQAHSHSVESRSALPALIVERVAVVALLHLKDQRALSLKRRAVMQKLAWNRNSAPCVHYGTPRCVLRQSGECSQHNRYKQNGEDGHRPAPPAFFAFTENEGEEK